MKSEAEGNPSEAGVAKPSLAVGRKRAWLAAAAALALVGGGAAGGALFRSANSQAAAIEAPAQAPGAPVTFADVAARVKPAVVSVQVRMTSDELQTLGAPGIDPNSPLADLFRRFGAPDPSQQPLPRETQAQGSGFFISPDGFIVTNNHVVRNARSLSVTLDDGRTVGAHLVATDPRTDLAVIKADEGNDYAFVRFAEAAPRVGDWVIAVGNPFGLGGTVTAGIVSAQGRDIGEGPYDDFLQIDAPVNQGNSGGPAFNMSGEVVGVNTAIFSPSGGNVGIAFAIPAAAAQPIVDTLRRGGAIERGYLGVSLQSMDEGLAQALNLSERQGALVADVAASGAAARAGLRQGDVILSAGGAAVTGSRDLARIVAQHPPGSRLAIGYMRGGRRLSTSAVLAPAPSEAAAQGVAKQEAIPVPSGEALGLSLTQATNGQGLRIVRVDPAGAAAERGLSAGDVITEAGGRACVSMGDFQRAVRAAERGGRGAVVLRVETELGARYVAVPVGRG